MSPSQNQQLTQKRSENSEKYGFKVDELEWEFARYFFQQALAQNPEINKLDKKTVYEHAEKIDSAYYPIIQSFCKAHNIQPEALVESLDHSFYFNSTNQDIIATKGKHHYRDEQIRNYEKHLSTKFKENPLTKKNTSDELLEKLEILKKRSPIDTEALNNILNVAYEQLGISVEINKQWDELPSDFTTVYNLRIEELSKLYMQITDAIKFYDSNPQKLTKESLIRFISLIEEHVPLELDNELLNSDSWSELKEIVLEQINEYASILTNEYHEIKQEIEDMLNEDEMQTQENLSQMIKDIQNRVGIQISEYRDYLDITNDLIDHLNDSDEPKIYYSEDETKAHIDQELNKFKLRIQRDQDDGISHGAFAKFRQGISMLTGEIIGVRVEGTTEDRLNRLRKEARLTGIGLDGVSYLERKLDKEKYFLRNEASHKSVTIMKFIAGKSLDHFIKNKENYTDEQRLLVGLNLCEALEKMQSKGLVHYDLKPENIIISDDLNITIIDYGLAELRENNEYTQSRSIKGTIHYMSPEVLDPNSKNLTGAKSDNWAMAIILAEVIGIEPETLKQLEDTHARTTYIRHLDLTEGSISSEVDSLLQKSFVEDPLQRPDIQEIGKAFKQSLVESAQSKASQDENVLVQQNGTSNLGNSRRSLNSSFSSHVQSQTREEVPKVQSDSRHNGESKPKR